MKLKAKFPKNEFPEFPRKQIFHSKEDIETRRHKLQNYLQQLVEKPTFLSSWELQHFLEIRIHVCTNHFKLYLIIHRLENLTTRKL